jgi:hypothetical protein
VIAEQYVQRLRVPYIHQDHWDPRRHNVFSFAQREGLVREELVLAAASLPRTQSVGRGDAIIHVTNVAQQKNSTLSLPWSDYQKMPPREKTLAEWIHTIGGIGVPGGVTATAAYQMFFYHITEDPRSRLAFFVTTLGAVCLYKACRYIYRKDKHLTDEYALTHARGAVLRSLLLATDTYLTTLSALGVLLYDPNGYR